METKHTKEEWIVEKHSSGHIINVTAGIKGFVIAEVTGDCIAHFIGNKDEAEANARLIAAAPEMLEALEHIIRDVAPIIYKMPVKKVFSQLLSLNEGIKAIHKAIE